MNEQKRNTEEQSIDERLSAKVTSLLKQTPDLEQFPAGRVVIPETLESRRNQILKTCFDGDQNPPKDWKEIFLQLFEQNPNNIWLWMRYGSAQGKNLRRTIDCWERVLEIDPNRHLLLAQLGYYYAVYGEDKQEKSREESWQKAKDSIRRSTDIDKVQFFMWHKIGNVFEDAILKDERISSSHAKDCYREALRIDSDYWPSLVKLGWLLARSPAGQNEAVELLAKARRIEPDCARSDEYISSITPFALNVLNGGRILNDVQQRVNEALSSS